MVTVSLLLPLSARAVTPAPTPPPMRAATTATPSHARRFPQFEVRNRGGVGGRNGGGGGGGVSAVMRALVTPGSVGSRGSMGSEPAGPETSDGVTAPAGSALPAESLVPPVVAS